MSLQEIRSNTVLAARRQDVELHTADGLTLVGELALPLERDPVATLVTLHPLPRCAIAIRRGNAIPCASRNCATTDSQESP